MLFTYFKKGFLDYFLKIYFALFPEKVLKFKILMNLFNQVVKVSATKQLANYFINFAKRYYSISRLYFVFKQFALQ